MKINVSEVFKVVLGNLLFINRDFTMNAVSLQTQSSLVNVMSNTVFKHYKSMFSYEFVSFFAGLLIPSQSRITHKYQ